jgi:hypothetical protein
MYKCIICDPDIQGSECRATGLFYTAASRATTFGDANGLNSAIYFQGKDFTRNRVQKVTKMTNSSKEFINVTRRREWVKHLKKNTIKSKKVNTKHARKIFHWAKNQKYTKKQLSDRIRSYSIAKNKK